MGDQEQQFLQEAIIKLFSMLHLNPPSSTQSPVSINYRTSSKKRRRLPFSSLSPFQKKLFTKRTPFNLPNPNSPLWQLQRSFSEPISYFHNALIPEPSILESLTRVSAQPAAPARNCQKRRRSPFCSTPFRKKLFAKRTSFNPNSPSSQLKSSSSEPISYFHNALIPEPSISESLTRVSAQPADSTRNFPISQSCDQENSPDSKRLKRMKDKMQEITEWCYQTISEEDDDNKKDDEHALCEKANDKEQASVWVEKNVGGFVIHFKCPCCCSVYDVLLSGKNCFYKIT